MQMRTKMAFAAGDIAHRANGLSRAHAIAALRHSRGGQAAIAGNKAARVLDFQHIAILGRSVKRRDRAIGRRTDGFPCAARDIYALMGRERAQSRLVNGAFRHMRRANFSLQRNVFTPMKKATAARKSSK